MLFRSPFYEMENNSDKNESGRDLGIDYISAAGNQEETLSGNIGVVQNPQQVSPVHEYVERGIDNIATSHHSQELPLANDTLDKDSNQNSTAENEETITELQNADYQAGKEKTEFCLKKTVWLGHHISKHGIKPNKEKTLPIPNVEKN